MVSSAPEPVVVIPDLSARESPPSAEGHDAEGERADADEAHYERRGRAALCEDRLVRERR